MFGYVTICKGALSEDAYNTFRAYYCGLCKTIGKRCSHLSRMGLSYDITFLAIMLSSLDKEETHMRDKKCMLHPMRKNICVENDRAVEYAADMGVILSYLKLLDDWKDEKSIKALFGMLMFARGVRRARKRYPKTYNGIRECLDRLSMLENENCGETDAVADCFAKILELLFTPDFIESEDTERALAWLGYNIGRWIYIIDAYNDIEKDFRRKSYNPFLTKGDNAESIKQKIKDDLDVSLTFTLENASSAYNLLKIYKNEEILNNIIYMSLKTKQDCILGEKNESI